MNVLWYSTVQFDVSSNIMNVASPNTPIQIRCLGTSSVVWQRRPSAASGPPKGYCTTIYKRLFINNDLEREREREVTSKIEHSFSYRII